MVYETRLIFDQLGISRIDRIGEPLILGNRSSIRSDLAKKAPSRANLEDRIEVQAPLAAASARLEPATSPLRDHRPTPLGQAVT